MTETLKDKVATFAADVPDWEVANALNAPDDALPIRHRDITISAVRSLLMTSGAWTGIMLTAENTQVPTELRALCITTRDSLLYLTLMQTSDPEIYTAVKAMCDGLLAANLITQTTHDKLVALADQPQSWADVNFGAPVTAREVGIARGAKP